ncbi:MAG: HAD family hydrolase [Alphaproteobacteria bacterium]|nr:HAD family hydrolase [Alphaproteobacteria bacterium]
MLDISKLKYALFDWDNTLVESRTSLVETVNIVLETYHLPTWEKVKYLRDCNLSFKDNFPRIFGDAATEAYAKYREIYLQRMPLKIKTFPFVRKMLKELSCRGILLYIVSNKERILLEKEKEILFPDIYFRKIVCGHEAPEDKPSPQQIFYALEEELEAEKITPEEVWMIGDSPMDSQSALNANAQAIRIGRSIWGDEGDPDNHIIYFNDFKQFYQNLGTKS